MIVIDASLAAAWCFDDEATAQADAMLDRVRTEGARVPGLWHLEIANVLRQAERRGRIGEADSSRRLELLAQLPILVDIETATRAWGPSLALARTHKLTDYDAAYLELATRLGLPLASKDKELLAAAANSGVEAIAC